MRQICINRMNISNKSTNLLFLFSAFALPPKILNIDWSLINRSTMKITERRAKSVELLTRSYVETSTKDSKASDADKRFEFREGIFQVEAKQLAFISRANKNVNLWSIPIGFEPMAWERARARTGLVSWDIYPSKVFFLDWGERQTGSKALVYKINWSEDSELVRFFECQFGRWILVENLPSGMTRLYFIEKDASGQLALKHYTVFDFNPKGNSSEVLRVENVGCHTFTFTGTFGTVRVRY